MKCSTFHYGHTHWCNDLRARPAVRDSRPHRCRMTQFLRWRDDRVQVHICTSTHQKHKNTCLSAGEVSHVCRGKERALWPSLRHHILISLVDAPVSQTHQCHVTCQGQNLVSKPRPQTWGFHTWAGKPYNSVSLYTLRDMWDFFFLVRACVWASTDARVGGLSGRRGGWEEEKEPVFGGRGFLGRRVGREGLGMSPSFTSSPTHTHKIIQNTHRCSKIT